MKQATITLAVIAVAIFSAAIWQYHTNSLAYELRHCPETSDNGNYIGFSCPDQTIYVPGSERDQVLGIIKPSVDHRLRWGY